MFGTNSSNSASSARTSWQSWRDKGKTQFANEKYEDALVSFRQALDVGTGSNNSSMTSMISALDRQLLLSNVVACRLKLGSHEQVEAAVSDAKMCININPRWSKGHVRLASAYIALGPHKSNDACNALQTAIKHDPNNKIARQMLLQELRRDNNNKTTNTNTNTDTDVHVQREDEDQDESASPPPATNPEFVATENEEENEEEIATTENEYEYDVDDTASLWERCQFQYLRIVDWYSNLNDDAKTFYQILFGLVLLYVAFGGRFGLTSGGGQQQLKGHYGTDNPYEQYHRQQHRQQTTTNSYGSSNTYGSSRSSYRSGGSSYGSGDYYGGGSSYGGGGSSSYYGGSGNYSEAGMFMGIILMGLAMYVAHWLGISPWQMMLLMNMANGGHRRHRRRGGGFGYGGGGLGGMGGMGYGGFNNRMRFGGRRRW